MRKWSGISTLRPLTTTSALGAGVGLSSSTIIERSDSMERIDMLGDSFLFRVTRALRAYLAGVVPTGHALCRRSPVQGVEYSPPTAGRWLARRVLRRREAFT